MKRFFPDNPFPGTRIEIDKERVDGVVASMIWF
jgi:hypothetical protein